MPGIKNQQSLNFSMQEVVNKKIIKWLDTGVVYQISNSKWVSSIQCVLKKGAITMVPNKKNVLILIQTVLGQCVHIDYKKLSSWNEKNYFLMSFMDQMLD